jgi:microcin C transport system permease protein
MKLSPISKKRIERFKRIKRGYYSLIILTGLVVLSLFAELLMSSRALLVQFEGTTYFPSYTFYSATQFGEEGSQEADYRALQKKFKESGASNYIIMPLVPYGPNEMALDAEGRPPYPPTKQHLLGTDDRGRDVLVRLFYGFRIAIFFSLLLNILANIVGVSIGALMGYLGGRFDILVQRAIEIWSTVPFLYMVIIIGSIFQPNFILLLVILLLFRWINITYYMRTELYREKAKDYCAAARTAGASHLRIIFKHLLPNSMVPLITFFPFYIVTGITLLTVLDFLGFGLPVPTPSWGEMMSQSMQHLDKLWLSLSPFFAMVITLLLVTFIGEAVREAFDPKQYSKYT